MGLPRRAMFAAAALLSSMAATCLPAFAQHAPNVFKATGDAPRFAIWIRGDTITFRDGAEQFVFVNADERFPRWNGVIYEARTPEHYISVQVRRDRNCSLSPERVGVPVEIVFDRREFAGCGGSVEQQR